ncbi:MAG: TIGR00282 family metallophosphoesterase [Alphaproteobacteria bacterium]|nr:TIGR00282 family metallophosphoesterase [Alphaproteobacteria bacterium]
MKILFCGDVVGRVGREAVKAHLPGLRRDLAIDVAVVNAENAAHGFGLTEKLCGELYEAGAEILTTGNHVWDQRELVGYIDRDQRVLRPANFPPGTPGAGWRLHALADGRTLLVVNLMGRLFMDALDDPFARLDAILADHPLGKAASAILVDFHAEASSEKMAMGHFADGRVSAVFGTHTHVPTADSQILPGGTGYHTDAGMCGDYDSVIGMQKGPSLRRFVTKMPGERPQVAEGEATLCAVLLETDDATGLARRVEPVRIGGRLAPQLPSR